MTCRGELDLAAVPSFRSATAEALADGWTDLIVDLGSVGFVDSAGIGALIGLRRRVAEQGGTLIVRVSDEVSRVLRASDVESLFTTDTVGCEP